MQAIRLSTWVLQNILHIIWNEISNIVLLISTCNLHLHYKASLVSKLCSLTIKSKLFQRWKQVLNFMSSIASRRDEQGQPQHGSILSKWFSESVFCNGLACFEKLSFNNWFSEMRLSKRLHNSITLYCMQINLVQKYASNTNNCRQKTTTQVYIFKNWILFHFQWSNWVFLIINVFTACWWILELKIKSISIKLR